MVHQKTLMDFKFDSRKQQVMCPAPSACWTFELSSKQGDNMYAIKLAVKLMKPVVQNCSCGCSFESCTVIIKV